MTAATPAEPRQGGVEVDLRWYVTGLGVIMACSFMAGLQQSPLGNEHGILPSTDSLPSLVDRSKVVRDAFLVNGDSSPSSASLSQADTPLTFDPTAAAAGEHLLVDIEGVDADFLDSESRLAEAMVQTAKEAGLELLSYHCHSLEPKGVSCVGVLLESHMSFHTWPDEGVITLDLYVTTVSTNTALQAKQKPLVPTVVESIKRLFGVRVTNTAPRPLNARWSHEFRGFDPAAAQPEDGKIHLAGSDLALWILSPLEMYSKSMIYSGYTQSNQLVDIWDVLEVTDTPSQADIEKSSLKPDDPRLLTPEFATPARHLFLNGKYIFSHDEESVLHETIAHPALFAHPRPVNVQIVAGPAALGNAVIREVLKHKTIQKLTAWHANPQLVQDIAPRFLKDLNNCSMLMDRNPDCLQDHLVDLQYYHEEPVSSVITAENSVPGSQDVLFILDYLSFFKTTQNLSSMLSAWMDLLTEQGVLLLPLGHAAAIHDPRPDLGVHAHREELMLALEALPQVAAMLVYEEAHAGSLEPLSFLLVCKHVSCRQRWYARSDQVEYQIYDRIVRSTEVPPEGKKKKPILTYFDGTTQRSYQWPKKGWETVYCKREPTPWECAYIHLNQRAEFHEIDVEDESDGSFRVEKQDDGKSTRVYATKFIPKGSYIMAEHLASSLMLTSRNLEGLTNNTKVAASGSRMSIKKTESQEGEEQDDDGSSSFDGATIIEDLLDFFDQHGHASIMEGSEQHYVEVGGSALIRQTNNAAEANIEPWVPRRRSPLPKYSPVYERHRQSFDVFIVAARDIHVGEEVVMHEDMWVTPTVD